MDDGALVLIEIGALLLGIALLGRLAGRIGISPIPLILLAGLAFGEGGLLPFSAGEEFIEVGWTRCWVRRPGRSPR
jgi:CPA2 family monovalent cation:H+ antiporter-2